MATVAKTVVRVSGYEQVVHQFELVCVPALKRIPKMEVAGPHYYLTARRDDVLPRRALLLRTVPWGTQWDIWDITPLDARGEPTRMDHPGGMQSDGQRLWIPVAESVRGGQTIIRVFALKDLVPGQPAKAGLEFKVNDHVGALAVAENLQWVVGAGWDTQTVYLWNFDGRLQRTLAGAELKKRCLGGFANPENQPGLAVQDWKMAGDRLFASGLLKGTSNPPPGPKSRLLVFDRFLEDGSSFQTIVLPFAEKTELAREAMALSEGMLHFVPEDLGKTNWLFRTPIPR